MKKYYVYLHYVEGESSPFYIGAASNLKRPYNFKSRSPEWFVIYNGAEQKIKVEIINVNGRADASKKEIELIEKFKHSVCNKSKGGGGGTTQLVLPKLQKVLDNFALNIKLARLRRNITTAQMAERANVGRTTYWKIENADCGVSIAAYINVLWAMGLEDEISKIAFEDWTGRKIQDVNLFSGRVKKNNDV